MEYFWFVDAWSVEYNFDALRVWDDRTEFQTFPAVQSLQVSRRPLPGAHSSNS